MHVSIVLATLMAIGSFSAPLVPRDTVVVTEVETDVVTVVEQAGATVTTPPPENAGIGGVLVEKPAAAPSPTPASPSIEPGPKFENFVAASLPSPTPSPPPPPPPKVLDVPPVPTSTPPPAQPVQLASNPPPSDGSPVVGGVSILTTINIMRNKYGLSDFSYSTEQEDLARQTADDNHGGATQNHEMTAASNAQVLTPGFSDDGKGLPESDWDGHSPFWYAVMVWLCEVPDPELGGQCNYVTSKTMMDVQGQTHHHDILVTPGYKTIGCAFVSRNDPSTPDVWSGQWACNLAF